MKLFSFLALFIFVLVATSCEHHLTNGTPYQIILYDDDGRRLIAPDESAVAHGDYVIDLTDIVINPFYSNRGGKIVIKRDRCYYFELQR